MISLNLNPVVIDAKRIISASSPPFSTNLRNPIPLTIQQRSRSNLRTNSKRRPSPLSSPLLSSSVGLALAGPIPVQLKAT